MTSIESDQAQPDDKNKPNLASRIIDGALVGAAIEDLIHLVHSVLQALGIM